MRKNKISLDKVQEAFNSAIRRRDMRCMIRDYEPCCGQLECSHYFTVGSSPSLRFYPLNAWTQCSLHHHYHHTKWVACDMWSYTRWLQDNHSKDYLWMTSHKCRYIKYTDDLKAEIIRLCNADKLDELKELIEENLK